MSKPETAFAPTGLRRNRVTIWLIGLTVTALVIWANFAPLEEIVRGPGKVIPTSKTQVIQSLEGGIIADILAGEGEEIAQGAPLVYLDETKSRGAYDEIQSKVTALEARLYRLRKELAKADTLELPEDIAKADQETAQSETQLFKARRAEFISAKAALEEASVLQSEEVEMLAKLSGQNLVPTIDYLKARQKSAEVTSKRAALESEYALTRSEEFTETLNELNQLRANLAVRRDQLTRTKLYAPVRGIVNKVLITTAGGVVAPGDPILELTPLDDELRIEARIKPQDIAFIYPKMRATVKLSAYDYTIYGSFPGEVVHISADTFEDANVRDGEPYYKVLVAVDATSLSRGSKSVEIRPGMLADAELHVGEKTVLAYLLKPLLKTTEAFREP